MDERLLKIIASEGGMTTEDLLGKVRKHNFVHGRIVYANMRSSVGATLVKIGGELGKDHSTIVFYLKQHDNYIFSEAYTYVDLYEAVVAKYGSEGPVQRKSRRKLNTMEQLAKQYAIDRHKNVNHTYVGMPYSAHLSMVVEVANKYIHLVGESDRDTVLAGCWVHDVIEDCRETYNDVKVATDWLVADLAYALTNEKGKTRSDRANGKYYYGIRITPNAEFIKLCDRIANVTYSLKAKSRMFRKYQAENAGFLAQLKNEKYKEMSDYLIELLAE